MDGAVVADALQLMESLLRTSIAEELRSLAGPGMGREAA
jgi:hypothetical protein